MAEIIEIISQPPAVTVIEASVESVVTISGPPSQTNVLLVRFIFQSPSLEWAIVHNKLTSFFQISLFSTAGRLMFAPITIISENEIKVTFTEPMDGYADMIFNFGAIETFVYE